MMQATWMEIDMEGTNRTPALGNRDTELLQRARQLRMRVTGQLEPGACSRILMEGFEDLSALAMGCRNHRIASTFRSLASIFSRVHKSVPEDFPFVMDTATQFLDTLLFPENGKVGEP